MEAGGRFAIAAMNASCAQEVRASRPRANAAGRRADGRLDTVFSVRSVFGRPMRFASRAAGEQFLAAHYRCFSGQEICPAPVPTVPGDYDQLLLDVRRRRGLTHEALARRISAASKAVVYQWESRKRTPSPVLWQRVLELERQPARVKSALRCFSRGILEHHSLVASLCRDDSWHNPAP